jgi:hypothetical protein
MQVGIAEKMEINHGMKRFSSKRRGGWDLDIAFAAGFSAVHSRVVPPGSDVSSDAGRVMITDAMKTAIGDAWSLDRDA